MGRSRLIVKIYCALTVNDFNIIIVNCRTFIINAFIITVITRNPECIRNDRMSLPCMPVTADIIMVDI